jgi:pilus assembly protein Flp/PilA
LSLIVDINLNAAAFSYRWTRFPDDPPLRKRIPGTTLKQHVGTLELTMRTLVRFLNDESGATAIEYGLIAAGISVAILTVMQGIGTRLNTAFQSVSTSLK